MKYIKQHKVMLILTIFGIILSPLIYFIFINTIDLSNFDITNFNQNIEDKDFRNLSWTKSINAKKYQIVVYDNNLKLLKVMETTNTNIYLDDIKAKYI